MNNEPNQTLQFETVVNTYSQDLYRYGMWLTKKPADAEDLVQETFLRAWKSMDTLKDPSAIKSWLLTILRRENARRFEKKQPELTSIENEYLEDYAQLDDSFAKLETLCIRNALVKMESKYLEPLLLKVLFGYSCKEIGTILEINPGAVMTRVFRAKNKLKKLLEEESVVDNEEFGLAMVG